MTILRSREIAPVETLKKRFMDNSTSSKPNEPSTPNSSPSRNSHCSVQEPYMGAHMPDSGSLSGSASNLRRSRRIASRLSRSEGSGEVAASGGRHKRKGGSGVNQVCSVEGRCESGSGNAKGRVLGSDSVGEEDEVSEVKEGVEMAERGLGGSEITELGSKEEERKEPSVSLGSDLGSFVERTQRSEDMVTVKQSKGKRKLSFEASPLDDEDKGFLGLRSGKKIVKEIMCGVDRIESDGGKYVVEQERGGEDKGVKVQGHGNGEAAVEELQKDPSANENGSVRGRRRFTGEEKGKGKLVEDDEPQNRIDAVELDLNLELKNVIDNMSADENDAVEGGQRYSREEKGKGILINDDLAPNAVNPVDFNLESEVKNSVDTSVSESIQLEGNVGLQVQNEVIQTSVTGIASRARTRFRDIARRNASRFAHFAPEQEMENHPSREAEIQRPSEGGEKENEDWPGPFSTAMKIIKDREKKQNTQQNSSSDRNRPAHVIWSPRKVKSGECPKPLAPSLQEMCLEVLAQNGDAITSLESIPDALRHKLSQLLCDSRRMNSHILELLVSGSPFEVCVRDCSWLTEEEFARIFKRCDTNSLTVLQLDQCGRCMTDYVLRATFDMLSNGLPALTTVSLKGACRLSDAGLRALVSSAPMHRCYAYSIGSGETRMLEVLSVAGIQTVCDDFIWEFISVHGPTMKELVLTDCSRLTDFSLKAIAETCPELRALDLGNLCKLTDSAFGYLASGCQAMQTLKLRCNSFRFGESMVWVIDALEALLKCDEAIAAFLEISGGSLKELSLNNVSKIGHNTAISLARRSRVDTFGSILVSKLTDGDLGFIVDSCLSLRVLKLFGCTQITNMFVDGHSNPQVEIIGLKLTPILKHLKLTDPQSFPL
ncbi:DNA repair protein rhp7 [Vitis vinifera]|uniref:DNA repair protein rhp7 n=1 Tax=Vitis vinifera TaxID=29760 RepID=A0A438J8Y4_VITVI|nr:DNA repair protein rhp7 [Vitis vinifera]